ncbi:TPA: aminopeptidase [Candidatus Taylorbacteria bacterium]|nr:aminopeptidase [Candidatus Taylorbacteria bacterium]
MPKKNQNKLYQPAQQILEKYAHVLVNFALGSGEGIKKGDTVYLIAEEYAKPLFLEIQKAIWRSGGHVISNYRPSNDASYAVEKDFYLIAENHQLEFFPAKYMKGLIDEIDHSIYLLSETDKQALKGIDAKKIMAHSNARKPYMEWRNIKENKGKFTWTLGLYGTPAMAKEAGLSLEAYWQQIIDACFLNEKDPVKKWKAVYKDLEKYRAKLNNLKIEKLHVEGPDVDLWIKVGQDRSWQGGSGRNIPSFELFASPDWRGTDGWIKFNQPLYRYGNIIEGIELTFKNGKVVSASAKSNESVLKSMIATKNADKVGEFSLTDRRFSKITHFMAETLFDENMGGPQGNTHIALGSAYTSCFRGDPNKLKAKDWQKKGFNDSAVHTDIISTSPRKVTAYTANGAAKIIYADGQFIL